MDVDACVEQLLNDPTNIEALVGPLPASVVAGVVDRLKQEADRHWWINANRSLELAGLIVQIGRLRGDSWQTALGTMARGDALKFVGQIEEAWGAFDAAAELFQAAGDQVGWARTRIGRLLICVELNRVSDALADAAVAREIFIRHAEHERLLGLYNNMAIVYDLLGEYRWALSLYQSALAIAETLGERGRRHLGLLYTDMGYSHRMLGDSRQALACYERARDNFAERDETRGVALAELNIAHTAMSQGHYRHALHLLHHTRDLYTAEQLPLDAAHVCRSMVECYLLLNRYAEACDLAQHTAAEYRSCGAGYQEALTRLLLATAEAELGQFEAAQANLDSAETIFGALDATTLVATTRLRRAQIALQQGDSATAARIALATAASFKANGRQVDYALATLLHGQASFAGGDLRAAEPDARAALRIAQQCNVPPLRYSAHLLAGHIAEAQGQLSQARRRYMAAVATVERVQRGLTITMRPGFLEDKGEALRALLKLHLRSGNAVRAFETLERAKSQVLLSYLANREQLRWADDDSRSRALIEELNQLRAEHQWFYRLAHDQLVGQDEPARATDQQQALTELAVRERRMRAITEQLYLHGGAGSAAGRVAAPLLRDVQAGLSDDTLLIEYYNDGAQLWAFSLDAHSLEVHRLPIAVGDLERLLAQLQLNLGAALSADARVMHNLTGVAQRMLKRLHAALLEPLAQRLRGRRRLAIVPYAVLHYLPFHLLHSGEAYLIEQHEVVVLPAAGLATRPRVVRPAGALVLAHSWDGRLQQTLAEAQTVQRLFGGQVHLESAANRAALDARPAQVLHIAAHGEHRLDQPDLSYIQLADGQLYTDDLLQHDLSYELVTLSACETGRANVAAGDELIGLGRGFLYAGAGALITSLWQVADDIALALMERVYGSLRAGASKAAALRNAQRALLLEHPQLHPAFWGAFQLVGDAGPLSTHEEVEVAKAIELGALEMTR